MQDLPEPSALVALVAEFLRAEIMPVTKGAQNFQLRVAINALDLAARQVRGAAASDAAERERLAAFCLARTAPSKRSIVPCARGSRAAR